MVPPVVKRLAEDDAVVALGVVKVVGQERRVGCARREGAVDNLRERWHRGQSQRKTRKPRENEEETHRHARLLLATLLLLGLLVVGPDGKHVVLVVVVIVLLFLLTLLDLDHALPVLGLALPLKLAPLPAVVVRAVRVVVRGGDFVGVGLACRGGRGGSGSRGRRGVLGEREGRLGDGVDRDCAGRWCIRRRDGG